MKVNFKNYSHIELDIGIYFIYNKISSIIIINIIVISKAINDDKMNGMYIKSIKRIEILYNKTTCLCCVYECVRVEEGKVQIIVKYIF